MPNDNAFIIINNAFEKTLQVTLEVHRQALESLGSERETFLALLDEYVQAYHHAVTEA